MTHSSLHDCFGFHLRSLSHGVVGPTPQTASPPWCRAHREQHPFVPSNSAHPCCAASPMSFQKFGENPFSVGKIKMPPSSKSHLQNKATLLRNVMTALFPSNPNQTVHLAGCIAVLLNVHLPAGTHQTLVTSTRHFRTLSLPTFHLSAVPFQRGYQATTPRPHEMHSSR